MSDRHRHLRHLDRLRAAERNQKIKSALPALAVFVTLLALLAWSYPLPCFGGCGY